MSNTNDAMLFTMAGADVYIGQALKALLSWVPGEPSGWPKVAELKVFLEIVWTNLFYNDWEAEAYRGCVIGLWCSGDGHVCAGQYTIFFFFPNVTCVIWVTLLGLVLRSLEFFCKDRLSAIWFHFFSWKKKKALGSMYGRVSDDHFKDEEMET